jgi:hypothetical protein
MIEQAQTLIDVFLKPNPTLSGEPDAVNRTFEPGEANHMRFRPNNKIELYTEIVYK